MKIKIADGIKLHQTLTAEVDLSDVDLHANYSLKAIKPFTVTVDFDTFTDVVEVHIRGKEIGRASCRERVLDHV